MKTAVTTGFRLFGNLFVIVILLYAAALLSVRMLGLDYAVVVSDSMQPVTARGDLVLLRSKTHYQIGDIVTFERAGRTVLHRIVNDLGDNTFRTKGDANASADPWRLKQFELQSNAVGRISALGWPLLWIKEAFPASTVSSQFTSSTQVMNQVESAYWGPFNFSWVRQLRSFYIDANSNGDIGLDGFNDRRFYLNEIITGNTKLIFEGKLDPIPSDGSRLMFFLNACAANYSDLNCGWVVSVKSAGAELRVLTNGNALSAPLANCSFRNTVDFRKTNRLLISKNSQRITVSANADVCTLSENVSYLVPSNQLPSGGRSGMWVTGQIRTDNAKFLIY